MRTNLLLLTLSICCITAVSAQNTTSEYSRTTSRISYTVTGETGWEYKDSTWWHNGVETNETPDEYVFSEERRTISVKNGVETRDCYKTTITVTSTIKTDEEGWVWKEGTWYYDGKKTDQSPKHSYLSKTTLRSQENIDCEEEKKE
ncbi:MAG: hypothetical protein LBE91_15455 [Tannerella sp.]|jgi:hypothetical protein|nr:hypothetical protein [Tannerella sp.]